MFKILFIILSVAALVLVSVGAEFTKLVWSECHPAGSSPILKFSGLTASPMPAVHPGNLTISVQVDGTEEIKGNMPTSLTIIRTVAGLALPVRCTIVLGLSVGSCNYKDLCKDVLNDIAELDKDNCIPELAPFGIDCKCPLDLKQQPPVDTSFTLAISDLSSGAVSFLASGDFDITARVNVDPPNSAISKLVTCLNVKFTVKKA